MTRNARHRHHRLRQHLDHLLPPRAAVQGARGPRLRRRQSRRRRGARRGSSASRRRPSRSCSPTTTSTSSSTSRSRTRTTRCRRRRSRPASTSIPRSRWCSRVEDGLAAEGAGRRQAACRSAARRTPSSAARTSWRAQLIDEGAHRHRHRRHRARDVPRHGALAPEPGLLLPAGRRADARHRPLLHRQPDQPDRPGEAGRRARRVGDADAHHPDRGPAQGRDDPGQDADQHPRAARVRTAAPRSRSSTSWDVWAHRHANMELYGTEGSLFVPDPNFFGGTLEIAGRDGEIAAVEPWDHPFGGAERQPHRAGSVANYRTAGLADMALAILEGREARCSLERALHGVDVMTSILKSGETGAFVDLQTTCTRPAAARPRRRRGRCWPDGRRRHVLDPPTASRYERMVYRRCGASGLMLPAISLGLWHNFGDDTPHETQAGDLPHGVRPRHHPFRPRQQLRAAARRGRGGVRRNPRAPTSRGYRDELIISSKAGYLMWPGPYGEWGSRKYLIASCDARLQAAWASTTSTSSTRTASTPTRRSRRRWARSTPSCGRARRSTSASRPTTPSAPARRRRS